ncbi:PEP-CTERM sorting domain-containing protein [Kiritimatiellaeota bacterium B1221]|nr:PEP-CTERM sorting domain-containing protein [Kiritimatiellaeota bacterium B1221]
MNRTIITLVLCGTFAITHSHADLLFEDSFETPVTAATTHSETGGTPVNWNRSSSTLVEILSDTASDGNQSLFFRDDPRWANQKTAVAITGGGDLLFTFDMKADNTLESADKFTFKVDFGGGYQTVLTDAGAPDGTISTYSGTTIAIGAPATGSNANWMSYAITVPETYYSNTLSATTFQMRFETATGSPGEYFHLDNITVSTIPEPSSVFLVISGMTALLGARRFKIKK